MSFVEAAGGKSQRKFGGVARWGDQIEPIGREWSQRWIGGEFEFFLRVHDVCTERSKKISRQLSLSGHAVCPKLSRAFLCRGSGFVEWAAMEGPLIAQSGRSSSS
jgi:hypothetical protein